MLKAYGAYGEKKLYGKTVAGRHPLDVRGRRGGQDRAGAVQRQGDRPRRQAPPRPRARLTPATLRPLTAVRRHCDVTMMSLRCRHAVSRSARARPSAASTARPAAAARRRPGLDDRRLAARRRAGVLGLRPDRVDPGLGGGLALGVRAAGGRRQRRRRLRGPLGPQADDGRDQPRCSRSACSRCCWSPAPSGSGWSTSCWPCEACVEVFFAPAEQAILPRVVGDEDLVAANGLNGQVRNLARLVGSALGGVRRRGRRHPRRRGRRRGHLPARRAAGARIATPGRVELGRRGPTLTPERLVRGRFATLVDEWRDGLPGDLAHPVVRILVRLHADHQHRRGDHGHAVRAVRPRRCCTAAARCTA